MTTVRFVGSTVLARALLLVVGFVTVSHPVLSQDQAAFASETSSKREAEISARRVESGTLIRAEVAKHVDWSHVPKGSVLEAKLSFPLYAGEQVALPAGTLLRVTIDSSKRVRKHLGFWRKAGRAIVRTFNPLEKCQAPQYRVTLSDAELFLPSGEWLPVKAGVVRVASAVMVSPQENRHASARGEALALEQAPGAKNKSAETLLLQLDTEVPVTPTVDALAPQSTSAPARQRARAHLLTGLSASQSHDGDKFQAQLAEPVRFGNRVFGSGSLVEGTIIRRTPPRILSRAGKLRLRMDRITAQNGEALDISGTLSRAEADSQTRFVLDEEGTLRGRKPGIAHGLVDLGMSYALGKVSDDLAEAPIRSLGASLSDATVANAARYVGLAGAVTFLLTRHGRDVRLPKYAQIEIDFGRPNQAPVRSAETP